MRNYTRIPAPRVTLVNTQTGIVADEWFRFFNNLYTIAYAATGSVTAGTYGSATAVPQITVDDFGTITGISNVPIAIDASQIVSGTIASARISGAYTGITGVGTLTVGTWNATAITTPYGGTGLTSYTAGDTLYYASGTALTKLAIGASTFINTSSGTAPQWTNPSTITIGKATNLVGGAANRIAYQTAADTTGFIVAPTVSNTYLEWSGTAFQWSSNPLGTVTSVSVVSANGLAGTVATATTTPAITLSTTVTGLLKGNGTAISAASSGTDYAPATSGTSILYGNGAGGFSNVTIGTGVSFAGGTLSATGSGGTVTSVTGTSPVVSSGGTTPAISLATAYGDTLNPYASKTANYFLAAPNGSAGVPTFRAMVAADVPALAYVTSVSGTGSVNGITLTGTVTSSGSLTLGGTLSGIGNSQLTNSTISGVALGGSLFNLTAGTGVTFSTGTTYNGSAAITINATGSGGTVTSVAALTLGTTGTDLSSTVANGTTTPVITLNVPTASAANRGALSAADWTTFNGKAPGVTFTTNYIPYGQGTTTLNQSANLQFNGTTLSSVRLALTSTSAGALVDIATLTNASNTTNTETGIFFAPTTATGNIRGARISAYQVTGNNDIALKFYAGNGATVAVAQTIWPTGGVSIGNTTDPGATNLSVTGTGKFGTTVGVGAATPSTSGAGITFPATQSASTDANTLDDYEEGTFTPTFSGGVGVPVYTTQLGRYTKIGRVVYFQINIKLTSGVAAAGQIQFSGLPFTVLNAAPAGAGFIGYSGNFVTAGTTIYLPFNNTRVDFYEPNGTVLTGLESPAITGDIWISGLYTTA